MLLHTGNGVLQRRQLSARERTEGAVCSEAAAAGSCSKDGTAALLGDAGKSNDVPLVDAGKSDGVPLVDAGKTAEAPLSRANCNGAALGCSDAVLRGNRTTLGCSDAALRGNRTTLGCSDAALRGSQPAVVAGNGPVLGCSDAELWGWTDACASANGPALACSDAVPRFGKASGDSGKGGAFELAPRGGLSAGAPGSWVHAACSDAELCGRTGACASENGAALACSDAELCAMTGACASENGAPLACSDTELRGSNATGDTGNGAKLDWSDALLRVVRRGATYRSREESRARYDDGERLSSSASRGAALSRAPPAVGPTGRSARRACLWQSDSACSAAWGSADGGMKRSPTREAMLPVLSCKLGRDGSLPGLAMFDVSPVCQGPATTPAFAAVSQCCRGQYSATSRGSSTLV